MKSFGLYVHIPYCLQICTYCDFVKFEAKDLPPNTEYISLLQQELKTRSQAFDSRELSSIYFGGGTPSLFAPEEILSILQAIANEGFHLRSGTAARAEITLEINPGTISAESIEAFLRIGITRFSVGAQTFDEGLLKVTGRKHTVSDTVATLQLLKDRRVNYSFDLLFGLPGQNLRGVEHDVARALEFDPSHVSAYNLTIPAKHPLNKGRASDDEQAEMFERIEKNLKSGGILRYEVSNFAKPGFESRHNLLYWSDAPYWGLGVGAHSYLPRDSSAPVKDLAPWGTRFWNPATIAAYRKELGVTEGADFWRRLESARVEILEKNEALSDFSHTALRSQTGLSLTRLDNKFGTKARELVLKRLRDPNLAPFLVENPTTNDSTWRLSSKGQAMADRVFESLTFLKDDLREV